MSSKKQLLDPIGSMCRIISLNFTDIGTKIGINNHSIKIYYPNMAQGIMRSFYHDNHKDISELYPVITRIIEWYILPLYKLVNNIDIENKEEIQYLDLDKDNYQEYWNCIKRLSFFLCDALNKLQETYINEGIVVFCLQYFILIIQDSLEGKYNNTRRPKCIGKMMNNNNFLDYEKIKILWNYKKVSEICDLYEKCYKAELDQDENKKDKIDGYLLAVEKLIEISDTAFRRLIELSNQG